MRQASTRLGPRGQVVIPAWVRRQLGLTAGERLRIVVLHGGAGQITLLPQRAHQEIEPLLEKGYRWLKESGVDLVETLHEARRRERRRQRRP